MPYLKKVVVNCGVGAAAQNAKALESTVRDLSLVTSQKPVTTRAKKAIAGFKLREGVPVGVCVTLRGEVCPPALLACFSSSVCWRGLGYCFCPKHAHFSGEFQRVSNESWHVLKNPSLSSDFVVRKSIFLSSMMAFAQRE